MNMNKYQGAWMTDIDDTLVLSGEMPDSGRLNSISTFIKVLQKHNVLWIPMSGVALVKLGPRILYRLPEGSFNNVLYYGGDGSLKYFFDSDNVQWREDHSFSQLLSDAQSYMIQGERGYIDSLKQLDQYSPQKVEETKKFLVDRGYDLSDCILEKLKDRMSEAGQSPEISETYFRGGSVSWMMLGDVSAEPYYEAENISLRGELIELSRSWLVRNNHLEDIGQCGVSVPFPGARGIKFVLMGNDKERSARDLIRWTGLKPEALLYAGNELFEGGNDNMLRNISGVTLLSVGDREDAGPYVVKGRITRNGKALEGIHANQFWMDWVTEKLENNVPWVTVLNEMRSCND